MRVPDELLHRSMATGIDAIRAEFEAHASPASKECLHYCLHEKAGSSITRFDNGVRDIGRNGETHIRKVRRRSAPA